jgi:Holliday junction resolvase-like predicted endonuclease
MNKETTTYKSDISIGVKSEDLIINWFKKNNYKYIDKRNDKIYRDMDIDFIIQYSEKYTPRIEVKTIQNMDYINIETVYDINNRDLLNDWLNCCKATYIFFVCPKQNKFIRLDYQKFKKWFMPLKNKHEELVNKTTIKGNKSHTSAFVKLPISVINKELFKIIDL